MDFTFDIFIDENNGEDFRKIVMKYLPEFRNDKHKVNFKFKPKTNYIDLIYIIAYCEGEIAGYMCYDIHNLGNKICTTTHCLSVRPKYRGNGLSEIMIAKLEEFALSNYKLEMSYEICNEISKKK